MRVTCAVIKDEMKNSPVIIKNGSSFAVKKPRGLKY
jgi:hypothetical protein